LRLAFRRLAKKGREFRRRNPNDAFANGGVWTALQDGDLEGVSDYKAAMLDEKLAGECKTLINTQLVLQTNEHVEALERMISAA
jgi:hypothetical protein